MFIYSIFDTLEALALHVTQCHAVASLDGLYHCKWQSCPRSDRGFNARYKMLVHVRTHTKEKPHSCDQCTKSFSRAENLKIHIRSHSGEKPYTCPVGKYRHDDDVSKFRQILTSTEILQTAATKLIQIHRIVSNTPEPIQLRNRIFVKFPDAINDTRIHHRYESM